MKEENLLKAHLNTFNMLLMKMKMVDLKLRKNKKNDDFVMLITAAVYVVLE